MDIVYIVESGSLCGGVRVVFEHAIRLKERGHKIIIASLDPAPRWFDLGTVEWWEFNDYKSLREKLISVRAQKVATWWKTAIVVRDISKEGEGCYFIQDIETSYYWRRIEKSWVESTYKMGLRHFTDEKWIPDELPGTFYVGMAYDSGLYKPIPYVYPKNNRVIACVRRQALKGFSELGEFSRKLGYGKGIELVTFGVDVSAQLGGAFTQHFRGLPDKEIVRIFSEGTVHVSTSLHEGFGLTMLEAMACGCPVATFDSDGNYFCEDGVNCIKVEKGDAAGLADATTAIIRDSKLRARLVKGGLDTARQFADWGPVIDKLEEFFAR